MEPAKTHNANLRATKHLKAAFQGTKLADLTADGIELYLRNRLRDRVRVQVTSNVANSSQRRCTKNSESCGAKRCRSEKLLPSNPCAGVEVPVAVKGLFRPQYLMWSEQRKIEIHAPEYLAQHRADYHPKRVCACTRS